MVDIPLEHLDHQLRQELEGELPGMEAHLHMAPPQRFSDKTRYLPNAKTRVSSVLILFYPEEGKIRFPMIVRPENSGIHSGQVALPGGKKDEEDQDLMETALRETWEEIGVRVKREQVIGQLSKLYVPPSNFLIYPFLALIPEKPVFSPSEAEVAEMINIDLEDFLSNDYRKVKEITARYMKAEVPYYDLSDKTVWGATAMILSELRNILKALDI